jgi:hypothetical protein
MKKIAIVGAGAVGSTVALILDSLGFQVTLFEQSDEALIGGATSAANINHSDGFEYYKSGHQATGEYCVDGAVAKALLFPAEEFRTGICTAARPMRFLVSEDSDGVDGLTEKSFVENAEHMRARFRDHFNHLVGTGWNEDELEYILGRNPGSFAALLSPAEFADCSHIRYGYAGSGTGVNMARYFSFIKSRLSQSAVFVKPNVEIAGVTKITDGSYDVTFGSEKSNFDQVVLTCAHNIPGMCRKIRNSELRLSAPAAGTYFLNAMVYVTLPPSQSALLLDKISRVNFTLQGNGGCMFACIVPPTNQEPGYGAIYYPSELGCQLEKSVFSVDNPVVPPRGWNDIIASGLQPEDAHVVATMRQACRYYPFLANYAVVDKIRCRTVFNATTKDSANGLERRVRDVIDADVITNDGQITAFRSPKWTNAELVALIAADHVLKIAGEKQFPKSAGNGFGPTHLDMSEIAKDLNYRDLPWDTTSTNDYIVRNHLPAKLAEN